jgi:DNA invertase Pin-like site-specific DNA recombinase
LAALEACRKHSATLLIARLDRLARNVAFIASLMESGVEFVAVDMPHASKFTIHILVAVAEHEQELISKRTKAALAAAKERGIKLTHWPRSRRQVPQSSSGPRQGMFWTP